MDEQHTIEQTISHALSEHELSLVVGGSGNPIDPVGTVTGPVDADSKATPIIF